MEQVTALQIVLAANVVVNVAAVVTAIVYYRSTVELKMAVRSAAERDGSQYAQSFQAQLWKEKKLELEQTLAAYKRAVEDLTEKSAKLQDKLSGLEQAHAELKEKTHDLQQEVIIKNVRKSRRKGPVE
jgi:predicted RNase H-like nuclease (RuvC/YqgF family)